MKILNEMIISKDKEYTKASNRFIRFPLIRMVIILICFILAYFLYNTIVAHTVQNIQEPYFSYLKYIEQILTVIIIMMTYRFYTAFIEKRKAYEISLKSSITEFSIGVSTGAILVLFIVIPMMIFGYYKIDEFNSPIILVESFLFFVSGAFIQEFLVRIIVFKFTEEITGTWLAIFITAAIFGFAHISNPNADVYTSIRILVSDLLLAGAFIYTRRIWLVWGIHSGWNYFQDGIFGMPNSGIDFFPIWIQSNIIGPEWITGGSFGIEASYIPTIPTLILGIVLIKMAINKNQIIIPFWNKKMTN